MTREISWNEFVARPEWFDRAECRLREIPVNVFFPTSGEDLDPAVTVCNECSVRLECLAHGLDEHFGVWGGRNGRERSRMRRRLRSTPA